MNYLLRTIKLSSLILMITIISDTQCMLRAMAKQNPRVPLIALRNQQRRYNAGHPNHHENPMVVWNKIELLEQTVKSLKINVAALEQNQTDMRSKVKQLKHDMHRHHHDGIDGSYIAEHNMHYGNKTHE
jgi:hypothetical protein